MAITQLHDYRGYRDYTYYTHYTYYTYYTDYTITRLQGGVPLVISVIM